MSTKNLQCETCGLIHAEGSCPAQWETRIAELEAENGRLRDFLSEGDQQRYDSERAWKSRAEKAEARYEKVKRQLHLVWPETMRSQREAKSAFFATLD